MFYVIFSVYLKMLARCYQKNNKERLQKRPVNGKKIFLRKRKNKSVNVLVNVIDNFLKKRITKSKNIVTNNIKIFLNIKNKGWWSIGKLL